MSGWNILWIVIAVLAVAVVALYFVGRRLQKKQDAQQAQIEAAKQSVSMLIIDKKRLRIKESGLPAMVIDQTPKYMRRSKLPIVKAKVGPKVMNFVADERIFDQIPLKKEVKAEISGIYIVGVKGIRGSLEAPKKKEGFFKRMRRQSLDASTAAARDNAKNKNSKKK